MEENMSKIRIAFIKYCGLSSGGTEKFLQTIAANLDKTKYTVDYYYTESVPFIGSNHRHNGTDDVRRRYLIEHDVNLIEISLEAVDLTKHTYPWVNTNFFELFDEDRYDLVQTGRGGYPEFPFSKIKTVPIIDSLHLLAGVDNQYNIARVMHITNWSRRIWENKGGDWLRSVVISHPVEMAKTEVHSLRDKLQIPKNRVICGFHQRNDESIFSPYPLEAYALCETENTHFIILGGSRKHRDQAEDLNIKNITFLDYTSDQNLIYDFLSTLDLYVHGRADGEVNSTAMAEAMYFGLPILSHTSSTNNGHVECIGDAGFVAHDIAEYKNKLSQWLSNSSQRHALRERAILRFKEKYELDNQMKRIVAIYEDVLENPFPHPIRRHLSTLKLRRIFVYFPKKITMTLWNKLLSIWIKKP